MKMQPYLTIEIHDVTPAAEAEVAAIRAALARIGAEKPALFVVPAFEDGAGRTYDLRSHPHFVDGLRAEQARGVELVLHGLTHRAPGDPPPGVRNWMMHHVFSRGCAEFAHLDRAEATRRLATGRRILSECGLEARGFVAPAWQQSPGAIAAVAAGGFEFTAFMRHLLVFGRHGAPAERVETPVLTFAAPDPWSDRGKRVYMRAVEAAAKKRPLLRVALHPEDAHGAKPLRHIVERLEILLESRKPISYGQWLAERASPTEVAA